jgi:hypothetical protein
MEHMNEGVKILIERLKTNPEDFHYDIAMGRSSKWNNLLNEALELEIITKEEKAELRKEVTKMGRDRFTAKVMQALLVQDEPSDEGKWYERVKVQPSVTLMAGQTLVGSSGATGTWGNSVASQMLADRYRYNSFNDDGDIFEKAMELDMSVEEYVRTRG